MIIAPRGRKYMLFLGLAVGRVSVLFFKRRMIRPKGSGLSNDWDYDNHYQWLCRVPQALGKDQKALGKDQKTLGKQYTTSTVSANSYLLSVFYRALGKWFAECQISHSAKTKVVYRVFFQNTLGKGLLFAECFWELHSTNLFSKKKSQHTITVCRVFLKITVGKPIF